jgi:hypothetical protein
VPSLREYLKRRRGEIRAESERLAQQRDKLQGQLHVLRARLDELDRESAELDQAVEAVGVEPDAQPALALQPAGERGSLPSTIKEAVLHVLADAPGGMTSQAILDQINTRFFSGRIERTSFSPQLSRLKGEHKVTRRGELWELAAKGNVTPGFEYGDDVTPRAGRRRSRAGRRIPRRPWRRQSDRRQSSVSSEIGPLRTERAEPETNSGSPSTSIKTLDPSGDSGSSRE